MTPQQQELYKKIDDILWDWDPIGVKDLEPNVNDINDLKDEYQDYIPGIYNLVVNGADKATISEHLYQLGTNMNSTINRQACEKAAEKIWQLGS